VKLRGWESISLLWIPLGVFIQLKGTRAQDDMAFFQLKLAKTFSKQIVVLIQIVVTPFYGPNSFIAESV
jgi:hypothetical protein